MNSLAFWSSPSINGCHLHLRRVSHLWYSQQQSNWLALTPQICQQTAAIFHLDRVFPHLGLLGDSGRMKCAVSHWRLTQFPLILGANPPMVWFPPRNCSDHRITLELRGADYNPRARIRLEWKGSLPKTRDGCRLLKMQMMRKESGEWGIRISSWIAE